MSNNDNNQRDVLDHLCATEPMWIGALQIVKLAREQCSQDAVQEIVPDNAGLLREARAAGLARDVTACTQLVCAMVLLASESPNPQAVLKLAAETLTNSPFAKGIR